MYSSGNTYEGSFVDDIKDGWGRMEWQGGEMSYEGEWKVGADFCFCACSVNLGTLSTLFASRENVRGLCIAVQDNSPHGEGVYIHKKIQGKSLAVNKYEGNFVKGSRHGHGTMHYADGSFYTGEWECNKKV